MATVLGALASGATYANASKRSKFRCFGDGGDDDADDGGGDGGDDGGGDERGTGSGGDRRQIATVGGDTHRT